MTTNTLASIKRLAATAKTIEVENFLHPEVSGTRTIHKAQTNAIASMMADGRVSWFYYPKASDSDYAIDGNKLTMLLDGKPAFIYTFNA